MLEITTAKPSDFKVIKDLAYKIWPVCYNNILEKAQLDYMLDTFYSEATLLENYTNKCHHFLLVQDKGVNLGFASYEHNYKGENATRIHKIYLLPETQGKGIGKLLMTEIEKTARGDKSGKLSLNVNRFNKALHFYQKIGFKIIAQEDIALEHGYLMEDYIMEKKL